MSLLKRILRVVQAVAPIAAAALPGKAGVIARTAGEAAGATERSLEKDRGSK